MIFKSLYNALLDAFFPPRCVFCGRLLPLEGGVCGDCASKASRIDTPICTHCGQNIKKCSCGKKEHYFNAVCAPYEYSGVVRNGIHLYKFKGERSSAERFASMIASCVRQNYAGVSFDFVLSVPTTSSSLKERGYDQTALLAKGVSEILGVGYGEHMLAKIYETNRQHLLGALYRSGNLTGVFDVTEPASVKGKTVLLIDDVSPPVKLLTNAPKCCILRVRKKYTVPFWHLR